MTRVWFLLYGLTAIQIEERDLTAFLGEPYQRYRERTPVLVRRLGFKRRIGKDR